MSNVNLSRRTFLRSSGIVGGGLVVGFTLPGCSTPNLPIDALPDGFVPNAFLQITPDNVTRFYCPRDEMGQGITTGLATIIGEELDADPVHFEVEFGGVHPDYANPGMGVQGTGGSTSIAAHYMPLRQVGANTRALLLEAAALDLGVAASSLSTDDGHVVAGGKRHPYGKFVATAAALTAPDEAPLKAQSDFRYIGKEFPRIDGIAKSTGTAQFGIDVDIPGMHHAVVKRSPVAGAKLKSVDTSQARQMPGVTDVFEISTGVAVVAEKYWQAKTAAEALSPEWEEVPLTKVDTQTVRRDYETAMQGDEGIVSTDEGDLDAALAAAAKVVEREYWTPYLAHAPLEPMNAVIRIEDGKAEFWSGTQSLEAAQGLVARVSGLEPENITAHNTYLGGAFGRRMTLTHIVEVTEIAMAAEKPIHLLWSREDDLKHGVYRPASLMKIKAGVDDDGQLTTWDAKRVGGNVAPDVLHAMLPGIMPGLGDGPIDWMVGLAKGAMEGWVTDPTSIEGLFEDYDADNLKVTHTTVNHGVPLTFWRSVGHSYTAFAKESMIDEVAIEADIDPVTFRLQNTKNKPRLHNVIKIAAEHMDKMQPAPGRHLGFAAHHSFATDVAEIAEVSVEHGRIRVHKVTCVVDCGTAVNPDVVRAQMEGGIMFGLTAALHGNLELEQGAIKESNFHDYPILRMNEAPAVEVIIVDSGTAPTGVGEPGLPPIAPAVANAVFRASGQRLRSLPLTLEG
jgi:isoquinoline 1-oxidoreductase/isoquinoline 1-oxidoreductase beta subunit